MSGPSKDFYLDISSQIYVEFGQMFTADLIKNPNLVEHEIESMFG